jgi:hypothetical protein
VSSDFVNDMPHFEKLHLEFSYDSSVFLSFLLTIFQLFISILEIFPENDNHLILLSDIFFEFANSLPVLILVLFFFLLESSHDLFQSTLELSHVEILEGGLTAV